MSELSPGAVILGLSIGELRTLYYKYQSSVEADAYP